MAGKPQESNYWQLQETTVLYRPVGQKELELIQASGYTALPPRLSEQPVLYPVVNEGYARQIVQDWNTKYNADGRGFVTRFRVRGSYLAQYEIQTVGGSEHQELEPGPGLG